MLLESLRVLLAILCVASICYYLAAMLAARRFFSRKAPPAIGNQPPVSIMIPLCGADFRAYENYTSLCRQDYPAYQIVFGVQNPNDSSIPMVKQLISDLPHVQIELVIDSGEIGHNPKVNNLGNMLSRARYDVIVLMDSDIRVGQDFLRTVVAELGDSRGGIVTCLYRAGEAPGAVTKLEAVGITTDFAPGVLVAEAGAGISFAFGAAIAIRKQTMEAIGGMRAIADFLADDYMIGYLVKKAGLPVRLSRYVVETVLSRLSMADFIKHQIRWARGIRACNRLGHTGSIVTNGTVLTTLYLIVSGFSGFGLLLFLCAVSTRLAMAGFIGVRFMEDNILRKHFFLVLARDFFSFIFWCAAICGNRVTWRGKEFRIDREGKMKPLV